MVRGDSIIQQNVSGGDSSRASICIQIPKYNTRFLFENVVDCSKILIYNISSFRKFQNTTLDFRTFEMLYFRIFEHLKCCIIEFSNI